MSASEESDRVRLEALEREIRDLRARFLPDDVERKLQEDIKRQPCPSCGKPMTPGIASIHGSLATFLVAGLSIEHLWLKLPGEQAERLVMESHEKRPAQLCDACDLVVLSLSSRPAAK
jgi:hypothetical protein